MSEKERNNKAYRIDELPIDLLEALVVQLEQEVAQHQKESENETKNEDSKGT